MQTIKYKTGRKYGSEQILDIIIESKRFDEFGFWEMTATFHDTSRGISGKVLIITAKNTNHDIGAAVLVCYDERLYTEV